MFRFLTLCLKLSIYTGALLTVIAGALIGPEVIAELGFSDLSAGIAYGIGGVTGIFAASILFGIPIVLLNINANLEQAVDLLKTMQQPAGSRIAEAVAPVIVDHALDAWESA
ncbi:MAG: hypothetical protein J0M09_02525 [Xanthomonadales bacterium]|nr:hypothetical protein [Xanthomonadales bacterium]